MERLSGVSIRVMLWCAIAGCQAVGHTPDAEPPSGDGPSGVDVAIGPEGGTITIDELTLSIPPGALSTPIRLHVTPVDGPPANEVWSAHGRFFAITPADVAFLLPVQLEFALDDDVTPLVAGWFHDGQTDLLDGGFVPDTTSRIAPRRRFRTWTREAGGFIGLLIVS